MACVIDNSMEPSATPKQLFIDDTTTQSMELPMSNPNTPLAGPLVWSGSDFNDTSYTLQLTKSDIEEVDAALNSFKSENWVRCRFKESGITNVLFGCSSRT